LFHLETIPALELAAGGLFQSGKYGFVPGKKDREKKRGEGGGLAREPSW
jgi:hypothetical protein